MLKKVEENMSVFRREMIVQICIPKKFLKMKSRTAAQYLKCEMITEWHQANVYESLNMIIKS